MKEEKNLVRCPDCYGTGILEVNNKQDLIEVLDFLYHCFKYKFKDLMRVMREYKQTEQSPVCPRCNGEGEIEFE